MNIRISTIHSQIRKINLSMLFGTILKYDYYFNEELIYELPIELINFVEVQTQVIGNNKTEYVIILFNNEKEHKSTICIWNYKLVRYFDISLSDSLICKSFEDDRIVIGTSDVLYVFDFETQEKNSIDIEDSDFDLQISSNEKIILIYNYEIMIINSRNLNIEHVLYHRKEIGICLLYLKDNLIVTYESEICFWNIFTGKLEHMIPFKYYGHRATIIDNNLIIGSPFGDINIFDLKDKKFIRTIKESGRFVLDLIPSNHGFIVHFSEFQIVLFNMSGRVMNRIEIGDLHSFGILPDNRIIAGGSERIIHIYDLEEGTDVIVDIQNKGIVSLNGKIFTLNSNMVKIYS